MSVAGGKTKIKKFLLEAALCQKWRNNVESLAVTAAAVAPKGVLREVKSLSRSEPSQAAGERYMKDGLVAAAGVHFWADIIWHVVWPLLA